MKRRGIILVGITVLIICGMWRYSPLFKMSQPIDITAVIPEKKDIYDSVISRGNIEEGDSTEIYIATTAKIDAIHAEIGDYVKGGDILFEASESDVKDINVFKDVPEIPGIDPDMLKSFIKEYNIDPEKYLSQINTVRDSGAEFESEIASPISGVITQINVEKDDIVSGYHPIAVVSDFSKLYVRVQIPEIYIDRVKVGHDVDITGDAFSKTYRGKVEKIYPKAIKKTSLTGTGETVIDTIISITYPDIGLKPGYSVSAKIYTKKKVDAITIPYDCIMQDDMNREFVFVIKDDIIYKKRIATGLELDDEVEIVYGLDSDETLVFAPTQNLRNGQKVEVEYARK